jgi:hypothetical protein
LCHHPAKQLKGSNDECWNSNLTEGELYTIEVYDGSSKYSIFPKWTYEKFAMHCF